jgi:hypothetical protein
MLIRAIPSPRRSRALAIIRRTFPDAQDTPSGIAPLLNLIDQDILAIEPNGTTHFLITTNAPGWSESHRNDAMRAVRQIR